MRRGHNVWTNRSSRDLDSAALLRALAKALRKAERGWKVSRYGEPQVMFAVPLAGDGQDVLIIEFPPTENDLKNC